MTAGIIATQLTTPDTTRAYTVEVGPGTDITGSVYMDTLVMEDQGTSVQATTSFRVIGDLVDYPQLRGQALVTIYDHVAGSYAFRGFVDSHEPTRIPTYGQVEVIASDHTSLLDNVIPLESRPAGESDAARIGYLWGIYAGGFLNASLAYVQTVQASMPAQVFAGITLRQALDLIAAQSGDTSTAWYLDRSGRLHYFASESNDAPYDVTSDTPGGGEIAAQESLRIDWDSKGYTSGCYVRGKTDAGSGWVYSEAAKLNHKGLIRTTFLDAPDCTTEAMRNALGNMYLGRLNAAKARGSFTVYSTAGAPRDGWRAGQNVTVRSTHLGNVNASYRIPRVRTTVLGPATNRRYDVEFGNARAGSYSDPGYSTVMGSAVVGDLVDDNGALLLSSSPNAFSGGLGPALRRYITSGVYNGDFALSPSGNPSGVIVDAWNPLPFWSFTGVSGTSISATSIADSASGSGRVIQFQMDAGGAAGDDAYLEQIIPVNGSRTRTYYYEAVVSFLTGPTVSVAKVYAIQQFLKADGVTTTGAAGTHESTTTSIGANVSYDLGLAANGAKPVPADAYYLRVRLGFKRDAAATSVAETVAATEVRIQSGNTRAFITDETTPTNGPLNLSVAGGVASIAMNANGAQWPVVELRGNTTQPVIALTGVGAVPVLRFGGASFPASPATNDLYYRTDLSEWCYYDGTRWLGELRTMSGRVDGITASSDFLRVPIPDNATGVVVPYYDTTALTLTTNDASNYWSFVLYGHSAAGAGTQITFQNLDADGTANYVTHHKTAGSVLALASYVDFYMQASKFGSPGALYGFVTVTWRPIYT